MSIRKVLLVIVGCGVAFAAAGGVLGLMMGLVAPWYYRRVFLDGLTPAFSPIRIGAGLGVVQGSVLGAIVGCVAVLASAATTALDARFPKPPPDFDPPPPPSTSSTAAWIVRGVLALGFATAVAMAVAVGFILGETRAKAGAAEAKLARLLPVLAEPPFRGVEALVCWHNEVEVYGRVASEGDRRALHDRFRSLFGDDEAREMIGGVEAAGP